MSSFSFFQPPKATKPFIIIYDYVYYFFPFVHILISSTFLHSFPLYSPTKPTTCRVGVREIFWEDKGPWMWGRYGRRLVNSRPLFGWVLTLSHYRREIIKGSCRRKRDGCLIDLIIEFLWGKTISLYLWLNWLISVGVYLKLLIMWWINRMVKLSRWLNCSWKIAHNYSLEVRGYDHIHDFLQM